MTYIEINSLPVVVIDNFYDSLESDQIWKELCLLNHTPTNLLGPEKTGSAKSKSGEILKQTKGIFLDEIYNQRQFSTILNVTRKVFDGNFCQELIQKHVFFKYLKESNQDTTLIQYYEHSDYYKLHWDRSLLTTITWFYNEPKSFAGGELLFEDGTLVECKKNRFIIFPSILQHEVRHITMPENLIGMNLGRYSISQFISIKL
jgi:predicted 2-oxoglutarate/Fe(II)-dependent dioxygenase YbiX